MFKHIKNRMFQAKIMAEIKAQYDDQAFVDSIFFTELATEHLEALRTSAYYRNDIEASFIHGCHILRLGIVDESLNSDIKTTCYELLNERLARARSNPAIWQKHAGIFKEMQELILLINDGVEQIEREDGTSRMSDDYLLSSEFSKGRYRLSYPVQTNEAASGVPLGNTVEYVCLSDDLDALQGMALMKRLGGVDARLIDTETGRIVSETY